MRNSSRSAVDPFIVMDVMEAARLAEAEGRHIIHMEVGQPGTPAPAGARDPPRPLRRAREPRGRRAPAGRRTARQPREHRRAPGFLHVSTKYCHANSLLLYM